jgi:nucleotide-binding universal stress UspA family protein
LKKSQENPIRRDPGGRREDQFQETAPLPQGWTQPYFKTRNLWGRREDSGLFKNPTGVLVGFDGSHGGLLALGAAVDLAQRYLCGITVVQVVPEKGSSAFSNEQQEKQLSAKLHRALENSIPADYLKQYPPRVRVLAHSKPAEALIQAAGQENCSLVVVGNRRDEKQDVTRLGSVACQLLKNSPCPVLVWPQDRAAFKVKRVMVPIEGSNFSYSPMAQAIFLCRALGADLSLFHISPDAAADQAALHAKLARMMEHLNWGDLPHELVTARGETVSLILEFCRQRNIDMIVMGGNGQGLGEAPSEKGVAVQVMERAACPVFVVQPRF